jgi:hypothetical protein
MDQRQNVAVMATQPRASDGSIDVVNFFINSKNQKNQKTKKTSPNIYRLL